MQMSFYDDNGNLCTQPCLGFFMDNGERFYITRRTPGLYDTKPPYQILPEYATSFGNPSLQV